MVRSTVARVGVIAGLALLCMAFAQTGRAPSAKRAGAAPRAEWKTYGADLASTRYSPLDQIDAGNFSKLQVAWRLKTAEFGLDWNAERRTLRVPFKVTAGAARYTLRAEFAAPQD